MADDFAHLSPGDVSVTHGLVKFPPNNITDAWASHYAEVAFVFGTPGHTPFSPADHQLSREVMSRWANFAKTGEPSAPSGSASPAWPKVTSAEVPSLRFQTTGGVLAVVQPPGTKHEQCAALALRVAGPDGNCFN